MPVTEASEGGSTWTTISVRPETLRRIKQVKRGGESFDTLLRKMESQYSPVSVPSGGEAHT